MGWATTLNNATRIPRDSRHDELATYNQSGTLTSPGGITWNRLVAQRVTMTYEYPGIDQSVGPALAAAKKAEGAPITDAYFQYGNGGQGSVFVIEQTVGEYVAPE